MDITPPSFQTTPDELGTAVGRLDATAFRSAMNALAKPGAEGSSDTSAAARVVVVPPVAVTEAPPRVAAPVPPCPWVSAVVRPVRLVISLFAPVAAAEMAERAEEAEAAVSRDRPRLVESVRSAEARVTSPTCPATEVTGKAIAALLAPVRRPFASTTKVPTLVELPYEPAVTAVDARVRVMEAFADPSNEADPVPSPVRASVRTVASFVAVDALPLKAAVIVPAAKLPLASRFTTVLAVLALVASPISADAMVTAPVRPATEVTGNAIAVAAALVIRPLPSTVIAGTDVALP